jgi:type II secretory pathway component PulF
VSPLVRYRAAEKQGRVVSGQLNATGVEQARSRLREQGLEPIGVTLEAETSRPTRRIPHARWELFFRSLASMLDAGMPLDRALGAAGGLAGERVDGAIAEVRRAVQRGSTLAEALAGGGAGPPDTALAMVRAGERGGHLGRTLQEAADHLEREAEVTARIRQALGYPILLACVGACTVLVIGVAILPRFAALLADAGRSPPFATRVVLAGSRVTAAYGWWFLGSLALSLGVVQAWCVGPERRRRVDRWLLAVPWAGRLAEKFGGARVARALAGALQAGVPLLFALDGAALAAGNAELEARIRRARDRVARGESLAGALRRESALPLMVIPVVGLGEQTGQLGAMVRRAGDLAAVQAERSLAALVRLLEPLLVLLFGGLVAFVAAALLQAVYSLRPV